MIHCHHKLEEKDREIERLRAGIEEKDHIHRNVKGSLKQILVEKDAKMAEMKAQIDELQSRIEKKDSEIAAAARTARSDTAKAAAAEIKKLRKMGSKQAKWLNRWREVCAFRTSDEFKTLLSHYKDEYTDCPTHMDADARTILRNLAEFKSERDELRACLERVPPKYRCDLKNTGGKCKDNSNDMRRKEMRDREETVRHKQRVKDDEKSRKRRRVDSGDSDTEDVDYADL